MRTKRQILVVLSLIGLVVSLVAILLVLFVPRVVPVMPEGAAGRRSELPVPFLVLPAGCGLIGLAMAFWMPAPWYTQRISILGIRRRRQNWALVTSGAVGALLAGACIIPLGNRQIHGPVAVVREGHYELLQDFQTMREISAEEYAERHEAQLRLPSVIMALGEAIFCACMYLGMALYGVWYIQANPQVDWREGFWDQFVRW